MRERLEQGTATVELNNLSGHQAKIARKFAMAHDLLLRYSSSFESDADFEA